MEGQIKKADIASGVSFYTIIDNRFKTNRISINIVTALNAETVTVNAIFPQILKKGFNGCDNYTELNRKLEELYGASVEADVQKKGDYQIITLAITGIDDRFSLNNEEISKQAATILSKMVLDPITEGDGFKKQYVELEKTALIDTIEAEINEKRIYALNQAIRIMCKSEPYGLPKHGFKDKVSDIESVSAKKQYDELIKNSKIEIIFTGCGDDTAARSVFTQAFSKLNRSILPIEPIKKHLSCSEITEETETITVNQSKMVLGFSCDSAGDDKDVAAMRLMTAVLGGTPSAKLFVNVREKMSLCYYCAARYDTFKGIITIDSGVENENIDKARKEILAQLDLMKKGEFTGEEIHFATLALINSFKSVYENDYIIENYYLGKIIQGKISTPEQAIEEINSITREDIIAAAQKVKLETVYILTGKEVE